MKNKKIALLINSYWYKTDGISGGDVRVCEIFKRLAEEFDTVDIYTEKKALNLFREIGLKGNFILTDDGCAGNIFLKYIARSNWVKTKMSEQAKKYDIVYASSDFFPDVDPCCHYKKINPDVKWIQLVHHIYPSWTTRPGNKLINYVAETLQKRSINKIRKAEKVIAISDMVKETLIRKGIEKNRIELNVNGVNPSFFKNPSGAKETGNNALFIGRLNPSKGIEDLVPIWKIVVKSLPEAKLNIVGGGEKSNELKLRHAVEKAELSQNIKILGYLAKEKVADRIKESQLFIFPSHEEGFGIAIAEAMACGLPVIAWDLPIYNLHFGQELTQERMGNIEKFADDVVKLFTNIELRKIISEHSRKKASEFSWDKVSQRELKIINDA